MSLIELPVETIALIGGVVLGLLGLLIQWIGAYLPWLGTFLEQYKQEWGMALSALLVAWLQNALPGAELAGISVLAVQLVVAIAVFALGKLGLRKAKVQGFI